MDQCGGKAEAVLRALLDYTAELVLLTDPAEQSFPSIGFGVGMFLGLVPFYSTIPFGGTTGGCDKATRVL